MGMLNLYWPVGWCNNLIRVRKCDRLMVASNAMSSGFSRMKCLIVLYLIETAGVSRTPSSDISRAGVAASRRRSLRRPGGIRSLVKFGQNSISLIYHCKSLFIHCFLLSNHCCSLGGTLLH